MNGEMQLGPKILKGVWEWGEGGRGSRVFIVILTEWVGFWVGFGFSYIVRRPRRCYGYVLHAYIIDQLSCPRCRHPTRLLLATPN